MPRNLISRFVPIISGWVTLATAPLAVIGAIQLMKKTAPQWVLYTALSTSALITIALIVLFIRNKDSQIKEAKSLYKESLRTSEEQNEQNILRLEAMHEDSIMNLQKMHESGIAALDKQRRLNLSMETLSICREMQKQMTRSPAGLSSDEVINACREAVVSLAQSFNRASGKKCRCCIKWLVESEECAELMVRTLVRSSGDIGPEAPMPVSDNTDFVSIIEGSLSEYFCNNLSAQAAYKNSSPKPWGYDAVIVWPIICRIEKKPLFDFGVTEESQRQAGPDFELRAFLCVDAQENGAFDEGSDIDYGWVVSDSLARLFEQYWRQVNKYLQEPKQIDIINS